MNDDEIVNKKKKKLSSESFKLKKINNHFLYLTTLQNFNFLSLMCKQDHILPIQ